MKTNKLGIPFTYGLNAIDGHSIRTYKNRNIDYICYYRTFTSIISNIQFLYGIHIYKQYNNVQNK